MSMMPQFGDFLLHYHWPTCASHRQQCPITETNWDLCHRISCLEWFTNISRELL